MSKAHFSVHRNYPKAGILKKIASVFLFAFATFLAGCEHKEPPRYLIVTGSLESNDSIRGNTDLALHNLEYNLDYRGKFRNCSMKDPIMGSISISFAQDECPTPAKGSELEIVYESCNEFFDNKCTYAIYSEADAGRRNVRVSFQVYPRIQ